jgi:murein DD-endopeptidase MepM/ murein hydrolase activator NlpD
MKRTRFRSEADLIHKNRPKSRRCTDMGVLRLFLCIVLFFAGFRGFAQESVHVVRQGDTVYSLSRHYGVDVQEILTLNGIADPRRIREGQRLRIPANGAPAVGTADRTGQSAARYLEYRAVRGDSLYALARRYSTTMEAIRQASGLSAEYVLKVGDRLRIPQAAGSVTTGSGVATGNGGAEGRQQGQPASGQGTPQTTSAPRTTSASRTTAPAQTAAASVLWPVRAKAVSYMTGKLYGVVLLGERSEPVKSLTQGIVVSAGPYRGFGRVAIVQMTGGYFYVYGGCESLSVREGDRVAPGAELGKLGIDSVSAQPQLFFMVYRNNTPIDPARAPRS